MKPRALASIVTTVLFSALDGISYMFGVPRGYLYLGVLATMIVVPVVWLSFTLFTVLADNAADRRRNPYRHATPELQELARKTRISPGADLK